MNGRYAPKSTIVKRLARAVTIVAVVFALTTWAASLDGFGHSVRGTFLHAVGAGLRALSRGAIAALVGLTIVLCLVWLDASRKR